MVSLLASQNLAVVYALLAKMSAGHPTKKQSRGIDRLIAAQAKRLFPGLSALLAGTATAPYTRRAVLLLLEAPSCETTLALASAFPELARTGYEALFFSCLLRAQLINIPCAHIMAMEWSQQPTNNKMHKEPPCFPRTRSL